MRKESPADAGGKLFPHPHAGRLVCEEESDEDHATMDVFIGYFPELPRQDAVYIGWRTENRVTSMWVSAPSSYEVNEVLDDAIWRLRQGFGILRLPFEHAA